MNPTLASIAPIIMATACGNVVHSTRPGAAGEPRDPTLVEVRTTGYDDPFHVVSHSTWDVDPNGALPETLPEDVMVEMRAEAARRGAEMLLLERLDSEWRKVWLGRGAVKSDTGDGPIEACFHYGFAAHVAEAHERAVSNVKRLLYDRPDVRGQVEVMFEVDATGRAIGAAATPWSSRDGDLQRCVLEAVYATRFGTPEKFGCQWQISVNVASPTEVY
jgi:hypothetical protein